jgi:carbamate kinase
MLLLEQQLPLHDLASASEALSGYLLVTALENGVTNRKISMNSTG